MYIRTKDGVYEVVTAERGSDNKLLYIISTSKTENTTDWVHEAGILKQSENLEELCDEFVGVDKTCENGHQLLRAVPYKCANFWNGGVFGAIWCEFGLKYVAKLNSKGELELI